MNKKITWGIMSAVMFISAGILIFYFFWANGYIDPPDTAPSTSYSEFTYPSLPSVIELTPTPVDASVDYMDKRNEDHSGAGYTSPVNFAELQAGSGNDSFYLSHDAMENYDRAGSLFVEHYNGTTFDDMVTIIYGHRMSSGAMFGSLQSALEDVDLTSEPQYIVIYLPDKIKMYQIFATVPHDNKHIMYYHNFNNESVYNQFISEVYSATGSEVDRVDSLRPHYGDKLLILSTCLRRDRTQRFLVLAKEIT